MTPITFAADPFSTAVAHPLTIWLAIFILAGLTALVFVLRASLRFRKLAPVRMKNILRDESGTAMMEFALLLPILLVLALFITQSTLVMGANIFVHYASFASARTAIVQIPAEYSDDEANLITPSDGSTKHDYIKQAAVMALLPIGGQADGGGEYNAQAVADGFANFYSNYGSSQPPWIANLVARRVSYISEHTRVQLYRPYVIGDVGVEFEEIDGTFEFEPKDPVTVEVIHGFYLSVPYASWAFSDSKLETDSEVGGGSRIMTLSASATLTLEGITDELPPEPELPRLP